MFGVVFSLILCTYTFNRYYLTIKKCYEIAKISRKKKYFIRQITLRSYRLCCFEVIITNNNNGSSTYQMQMIYCPSIILDVYQPVKGQKSSSDDSQMFFFTNWQCPVNHIYHERNCINYIEILGSGSLNYIYSYFTFIKQVFKKLQLEIFPSKKHSPIYNIK